MLRRIKRPLAIVAALILAFAAYGCAGRNADKAVSVMTAAADNQELETTLELSGVLVQAQKVDISSKISGKVISLGYNTGSAVKAGDVLIQLDTEVLSAQLMQAQAGLQSAEAAADAARNQASITKINLDAAQKLYDRTKALNESGAVSQSQMDEVADKLNTAEKQFENAAGPAQDQAQAAVNTARANIKNLQAQIDNATIRSPIDGLLVGQNVNVGEVLSPGVAVISIVDTSTLKLKSTVTQDLLPLLSAGQEMDITVDIYPDSKFIGTVSSVGPIAVNTGELFPVEIAINNNGSLTAGLTAHASVTAKTQGIVVPSSSVIQNGGESYIFVIKDNIASKRVVKIGLKNDKGTQILKGLNAGELVAVTNAGSLTDSMPVITN
ncbi:MAG: Macrolide export protein MacA [Pelotomaculum sp. PtaU1.Bin035]|nr:MAG: Macrolide export protein MacA [Pelotomaculum sp. PtaU1.Bin035]